jgi:Zn-dependent peptidase ImmA (M78 family)
MLAVMPRPPTTDRSDASRARAEDLLRGRDGDDVPTMSTFLRICRERGVAVLEADLRDLQGALTEEKNLWRIALNRDDSPDRRRFTLVRLLGHACLHARPGRTFVEGGVGEVPMRATPTEDREATAFALALLLPEPLIRRQLPDDSPAEREVLTLAARCGVSPLATAVRLRALGYRLPRP